MFHFICCLGEVIGNISVLAGKNILLRDNIHESYLLLFSSSISSSVL